MDEYFELKPDEGFEFLLGEDDGFKLFNLFRENKGRQIGKRWLPLTITVVSENRRKPLKAGDFLICFWSAFFFRESVRRVMGNLLKQEGEVLPFASDKGEQLYFLNPSICDCLVASGEYPAKVVPLGVPGKWHAWCQFDEDKCRGRHAFMVPELWPRTFVSGSLVDRIKASGFTGACFDSVTRPAITDQ
jgi:hypothetical protein